MTGSVVTGTENRHPTFLGIDPPTHDPLAVVLPVPYEASTSYLQGTGSAPEAILEASVQVELHDEDAGDEPCEQGLLTLPALDVGGRPAEVVARIADAVDEELGRGRFVCSLGGEHTMTVGCVRGAARHADELVVVSIDAHADLRSSYRGSELSHACVMRRLVEDGRPIVEVGVRSLSAAEARDLPSLDVTVVRAAEIEASRRTGTGREWIDRVAAETAARDVYLSVDLDGLDPSVLPGVGTPEPGGLLWYETLDLIAHLFEVSHVVAADLVELCPRPGEDASSFAAARLAYKIIGHALRKRARP
jgi:agmatinase